MLGTRVDGYDQSGDEVVARELGRGGGGLLKGAEVLQGSTLFVRSWCRHDTMV